MVEHSDLQTLLARHGEMDRWWVYDGQALSEYTFSLAEAASAYANWPSIYVAHERFPDHWIVLEPATLRVEICPAEYFGWPAPVKKTLRKVVAKHVAKSVVAKDAPAAGRQAPGRRARRAPVLMPTQAVVPPRRSRVPLVLGLLMLLGLAAGVGYFFLGRDASSSGQWASGSAVQPRSTEAAAQAIESVTAEQSLFEGDRPEQEVAYAGLPVAISYEGAIQILEKRGFVVGYDNLRRVPAWVAYRLDAAPRRRMPERPPFLPDPEAQNGDTEEDYERAYYRSGYDRGHMAPFYGMVSRYGDRAGEQSMLFTNIAPQKSDLNQGPWALLEMDVSFDYGYSQAFRRVWVITGPLYDRWPQFLPNSKIEIPDAFFKILLIEHDAMPQVLAFRFSQNTPGDVERFDAYLTSVDALEAESGLDFLPLLNDSVENALEAQPSIEVWPLERPDMSWRDR